MASCACSFTATSRPGSGQRYSSSPNGIVTSTRERAPSRLEILSSLLREGIEPNPGPQIRVGQVNFAGLPPQKRPALLRLIATHNIDILLLQELHLSGREASALTLPGFNTLALGRDFQGGGVAIFAKDAIPIRLLSTTLKPGVLEQLTVQISIGDQTLRLTTGYFPRGQNICESALEELDKH